MSADLGTKQQSLAEVTRLAIRIEMMRRDWTQTDLAERLGIDQSTVSKVVRGKVKLTLDDVEHYAAIFGIPPEALMGLGPWAQNWKHLGRSQQLRAPIPMADRHLRLVR